jgi:hypothetical protein
MLVDAQHFSASKNLVKSRAFLPGFYQDVYSTSTFDVDGLSRDDIWELGRAKVAVPRNKTLYGHAELRTADVLGVGLAVARSQPPERHCDIVQWPAEKEDRMSVAQELARAAQLVLRR